VYVADRDFSSNFLCNDYSASDGNIDYNATATTTSTKATTTTTTVAKSTTTTAALTEPVLGGTLTYFGEYANGSPPSWDDVTTGGVSATDFWSNPYGESLLRAT